VAATDLEKNRRLIFEFMNKRLIPTVALMAVLTAAPLVRLLYVANFGRIAAPAGAMLRWMIAATATVGAYHTVSAASAAIVGLTKYTNNTPLGGPTNHAYGVVGQPFRYRITVSNAGSDHNKDYFNCIPLPPGLMINTNYGGNGFITNTPTAAGDYQVTLVAGNRSYPDPVTYQAIITILPDATASVPPKILSHPASATVLAGAAATFSVTAEGSPPLTYQWMRDSSALDGATDASLTLTSVAAADAGVYTVRVSNAVTNVVSEGATLSVAQPPLLSLNSLQGSSLAWQFNLQPNAAYTVEYSDASVFGPWHPLTNYAGQSGGDEAALVIDSTGETNYRIYRVRMSLP
jgi:hypothetical protein